MIILTILLTSFSGAANGDLLTSSALHLGGSDVNVACLDAKMSPTEAVLIGACMLKGSWQVTHSLDSTLSRKIDDLVNRIDWKRESREQFAATLLRYFPERNSKEVFDIELGTSMTLICCAWNLYRGNAQGFQFCVGLACTDATARLSIGTSQKLRPNGPVATADTYQSHNWPWGYEHGSKTFRLKSIAKGFKSGGMGGGIFVLRRELDRWLLGKSHM